MSRPWSGHEETRLRYYWEKTDLSQSEIGKLINRNRCQISGKISRMKLSKRRIIAPKKVAPPIKKLILIAGTYKEAMDFARAQKLSPNAWMYPHDAHQLQGLRDHNYMTLGTWFNRMDIPILEELIKVGGLKEVNAVIP